MGSALNQSAVETYVVDMQDQLAALLEDIEHPLARQARVLASALRSPDQKREDRPTA